MGKPRRPLGSQMKAPFSPASPWGCPQTSARAHLRRTRGCSNSITGATQRQKEGRKKFCLWDLILERNIPENTNAQRKTRPWLLSWATGKPGPGMVAPNGGTLTLEGRARQLPRRTPRRGPRVDWLCTGDKAE